jgi:arylsulfatase A-like enzyme
LIDEAVGQVIDWLQNQGLDDQTDIFFTTDHGELQGDFGLMFKGPYHIDALMRLPLIWRPAPSAGTPSAVVTRPVGHVDLAKTFCDIADIPVPHYCEGLPLPLSEQAAAQQSRNLGFDRMGFGTRADRYAPEKLVSQRWVAHHGV